MTVCVIFKCSKISYTPWHPLTPLDSDLKGLGVTKPILSICNIAAKLDFLEAAGILVSILDMHR